LLLSQPLIVGSMSKDNTRRNKACSASACYHNYNTCYQKPHPCYNTLHCSSSHSGSHNDVNKVVDTSTKKAEGTCPKYSASAVLVHWNKDKLTIPPSSVVTAKHQSNRHIDEIPVIMLIQNPYKHHRNTCADTSNASMPNLVVIQNASASTPNGCNTVSPLSECLISTAQNSHPISYSPPTQQTSVLTIAQKFCIAMNKARALAIRAKAAYTTPLMKKEAVVSPMNQEYEQINSSSVHVDANVVSSKSAMMTTKWHCGSIVNAYIVDWSIIANGDPICANCLANIEFSQDSVASINV
jgi:hypothetical protein